MADITWGVNLLPNNEENLGSSTKKWNDVYAKTFNDLKLNTTNTGFTISKGTTPNTLTLTVNNNFTTESKSAVSGGTDLSLVTTGDKAIWDAKGNITEITMNGVSKGTSGVVDLGTVITAHQDISGKVDKVNGKGLSTNDYTTTEKNKLAGIAEGATANIGTVTKVKINNSEKSPNSSGVVDLGSGYLTAH